MYTNGVRLEKNYVQDIDIVKEYASKLMHKINSTVIEDDFNLDDQEKYLSYLSPIDSLIKNKKKILIYNWIQFDNDGRIGGGVTVYCYNLIKQILKDRPDIDIYFLSSGWTYDISTTKTYIRSTSNCFGERCKTFEIVNSPVPAAQDMILNAPSIAFNNLELKQILDDFIEKNGTFSVIHFNNIEGLSLNVFELKEKYNETKFVYSMHNYIPLCVTGFYYDRGKHINCVPDHNSEDCLGCIKINERHDISDLLLQRANNNCILNRKPMDPHIWIDKMQFTKLSSLQEKENLVKYTILAKEYINKYVDVVLAVSKRVAELAEKNGIKSEKIIISYIGTRIAEYQVGKSVNAIGDKFKIVFLGSNYFFEEKGYPFLMDTLESFEEKDAKKIDLVLTTISDKEEEIKRRLSKFNNVYVKKGYKHSELESILNGVNLGIVPVLWEDNLPQIAIEMTAMGVPVLASDFGGASELSESDKFKFKGGDKEDLKNKILNIVNNPTIIEEYWDKYSGLVKMSDHLTEILKIYGITEKKDEIKMTFKEYTEILNEVALLRTIVNGTGNRTSGKKTTNIISGGLKCIREHGLKYTIHYLPKRIFNS